MAQITSGRVLYSRTVQPQQFESKRAEVELSFVLAEGEKLGDILKKTGEIVRDQAMEMVGLHVPEEPVAARSERRRRD